MPMTPVAHFMSLAHSPARLLFVTVFSRVAERLPRFRIIFRPIFQASRLRSDAERAARYGVHEQAACRRKMQVRGGGALRA